jgi:hypothetical protein
MFLSQKHKDVLKSLASINDQVYFKSDELGIASNDKQMLAYYDYGITIDMPDESDGFGVFNLNEFLSLLDTYKNPTIKEGTDHLLISEDKSKNKFKYTAKNCISVPPSKKMIFEGDEETPAKIEPAQASFELSKEMLGLIIKQSTILKSPHIKFEGNTIQCTDIDNSSVNTFTFEIPGLEEDSIPKCVVSAEKFQKLISDGYDVAVNDKTVVFKNEDNTLTYIIVGLSE